MEQTQQPKRRSMRELHRLVAEDTARWNHLGEVWPQLSVSQQEELIMTAQAMAERSVKP